jgi:hypothetical protein
MADILVGEIYMATTHDPQDFRPMDPRRVKRLAAIYQSTWWDCAETVNRLIRADECSRIHRSMMRR